MGTTVIIIVVVLLALVGAGVGALVATARKKSAAPDPGSADRSRSTIAPAAPMTGLESALDQAMDRTGRNMREKLEAEAPIVDGLKSSDDTGPILRRALDRVEHPGDDAAAAG